MIELARDPHEPRGPKDGGHTIVTAARAAALAAAAEAAWHGAGHSAAEAVDGATRGGVNDISLATALERAARAAASRLHLDRDAVDQALEQAEAAGRVELGRLIGEGPDRAHPLGSALDAARDAAADSDGGRVWSEVQELTRGVIGAGAWSAGMAAARVTVDRVLQTATSLVDRAVLVAMAREAAGLAARAVAAGAWLGDAPDGGQDDAPVDGETEGPPPVEPRSPLTAVVDGLQASALQLFDALLDVRDPATRAPRARHPKPRASSAVS